MHHELSPELWVAFWILLALGIFLPSGTDAQHLSWFGLAGVLICIVGHAWESQRPTSPNTGSQLNPRTNQSE